MNYESVLEQIDPKMIQIQEVNDSPENRNN